MLSNISILLFLNYILPLLRDFKFDQEDGNHRILLIFEDKTEPMLYDVFERKNEKGSFYPIYSSTKMTVLKDHTLAIDLNFIDKNSDSQYKISIDLGNDGKFYSVPFVYNKKQDNFEFV